MAIITKYSGGVVTRTNTTTGQTTKSAGYGSSSAKLPPNVAKELGTGQTGDAKPTSAAEKNKEIAAAREMFKEEYGHYPSTTSDLAKAKQMAGMEQPTYKITKEGKLLNIPENKVVAENVSGFVQDKSGKLVAYTYKENVAGPAGRTKRTVTPTGQLQALETDQVYYTSRIDGGKLFIKDQGQLREFDARSAEDMAAAEKAGFDVFVPKELLPQTEWYHEEEEKRAIQRGAEALAGQLEYEYRDYLTIERTPEGNLKMKIIPGVEETATPVIERALGYYTGIFEYTDVTSPRPGEYIISQREPESVAYITSRELGEMFASDAPISVGLSEDYEAQMQLESGEVVRYSELTAGQKEAFRAYFGGELEAIKADVNQQIYEVQAEYTGQEPQSFATQVTFEEKDGALVLSGVEKYTTFQEAQTRFEFLPPAEVGEQQIQVQKGPATELENLEGRISKWDKMIDEAAEGAWGKFESPTYEGVPRGREVLEIAGRVDPFAKAVGAAVDVLPKEVTRTITYWPQRLIVDTAKGGVRAGEMFITAGTGLSEAYLAGKGHGYIEVVPYIGGFISIDVGSAQFKEGTEKLRAPMELIRKYPVETGIAIGTIAVPGVGGVVGRAVGGAAGKAVYVASQVAVPTVLGAGLTQHEMEQGFDLPEAFARGFGTIAFAYGAGHAAGEAIEAVRGARGAKTLVEHPTRIKTIRPYYTDEVYMRGTVREGVLPYEIELAESIAKSRAAKAEYLRKTRSDISTPQEAIDTLAILERERIQATEAFKDMFQEPGRPTVSDVAQKFETRTGAKLLDEPPPLAKPKSRVGKTSIFRKYTEVTDAPVTDFLGRVVKPKRRRYISQYELLPDVGVKETGIPFELELAEAMRRSKLAKEQYLRTTRSDISTPEGVALERYRLDQEELAGFKSFREMFGELKGRDTEADILARRYGYVILEEVEPKPTTKITAAKEPPLPDQTLMEPTATPPKKTVKIFTLEDILKRTGREEPTVGKPTETGKGTLQVVKTVTKPKTKTVLETKQLTKQVTKQILKTETIERYMDASSPLDQLMMALTLKYGGEKAAQKLLQQQRLLPVTEQKTTEFTIQKPQQVIKPLEAQIQPQKQAVGALQVPMTRTVQAQEQPLIQLQEQPMIQIPRTLSRQLEATISPPVEKLAFLIPDFGGKKRKKKKEEEYIKALKVPKGKRSLYADLLSVVQTELAIGPGKARQPSLRERPELWREEVGGRIPTAQMAERGGIKKALPEFRKRVFGKFKKVKYL